MLSRLVLTFLPRSKLLLVSWLQSPSVVILEPQKIKSDTVSTVSPSISHEVLGPEMVVSPSTQAAGILHTGTHSLGVLRDHRRHRSRVCAAEGLGHLVGCSCGVT